MPAKRKVDIEQSETKKLQQYGGDIVSNKHYNFEEELEGLEGSTLVARLLYIAQRCPEAAREAYSRALRELKNGKAYKLTAEVVQQALDSPFLNPADLQADLADTLPSKSQESLKQETTFRLQHEVTENKRVAERDVIRKSLIKLAKHFVDYGEPMLALPLFFEARDMDANNKDVVETSMNIILCSFQLNNLGHVAAQVARAKRTPELKSDPLFAQKLTVCSALVNLRNRNYRAVAAELLQTTLDLKNQFGEVASIRELAAIGTMCCLATQNRAEIKANLLEGTGFREILEMVSPWRVIISEYTSSRYASAFSYLDAMTQDRKLDLHLGLHWQELVGEVRDRGLVQYFSPFLSIRLSSLMAVFGMDAETLDSNIIRLIQHNKLQARIDRQEKVLYAKVKDLRSSTFTHAFHIGADFSKDISAMLMQLSLTENQFIVKDGKGRKSDARDTAPQGPLLGRRRQRDERDDLAMALSASMQGDGRSSSSSAGTPSKPDNPD
jgi:COP9 signalosome complex subunit 1